MFNFNNMCQNNDDEEDARSHTVDNQEEAYPGHPNKSPSVFRLSRFKLSTLV